MKQAIKPSVIFNVLANEHSIGLTFNKAKAEGWLARSSSTSKRIVAVPYKEPQGLTYEVNYYGIDA